MGLAKQFDWAVFNNNKTFNSRKKSWREIFCVGCNEPEKELNRDKSVFQELGITTQRRFRTAALFIWISFPTVDLGWAGDGHWSSTKMLRETNGLSNVPLGSLLRRTGTVADLTCTSKTSRRFFVIVWVLFVSHRITDWLSTERNITHAFSVSWWHFYLLF